MVKLLVSDVPSWYFRICYMFPFNFFRDCGFLLCQIFLYVLSNRSNFHFSKFLRSFLSLWILCIEEKNNFLPVRVWLTHFMTLFPFYTPWKHLHFLLFRGYRKGQVVRNRCVLKQSPKGVLWKRRSLKFRKVLRKTPSLESLF